MSYLENPNGKKCDRQAGPKAEHPALHPTVHPAVHPAVVKLQKLKYTEDPEKATVFAQYESEKN